MENESTLSPAPKRPSGRKLLVIGLIVLALVLAAALLIVFVAPRTQESVVDDTPSPEWNMATLSVGNFELDIDGEALNLPLTLRLGGGADIEGERFLAVLELLAGDEIAATVRTAVENGEIKALLDGMDYGLVLPLDDIISMIESEAGASLEDLMSGAMMPAETQESVTRLTEALSGLAISVGLNPDDTLAAIGLTSEEAGKETVTIFEEEIETESVRLSMEENTLLGLIDATSEADADWANFWAAWYDLFLTLANEEGEEITMEDLDEVFAEVSFGFDAVVYSAENASMTDMVVSMTADGETVELPISFASMEADGVSRTEVFFEMTVEDEGLLLTVSTETSEAGYATEFFVEEYDAETEETINGILLDVDGFSTEEGVEFNLGLYTIDEWGDEASIGIAYQGNPAVITEDSTSYEGALGLHFSDGEAEYSIGMDTGLTLGFMPEGELLSLSDNSINPLTADEDTMEQFTSDAQPVLFQALGVMMQNPELSALLSELMS